MKTKIVEIGGSKFQIRKMSPAAGSFIYYKMLGALVNRADDATTEDSEKAKKAATKMSPEDKARILCVSTFMSGLEYQYVEFAQKQAMLVTSRMLGEGSFIPVMGDNGRWVAPAAGEVDLEDEPSVVQHLTMEAVVFSVAGFFSEGSTKQ